MYLNTLFKYCPALTTNNLKNVKKKNIYKHVSSDYLSIKILFRNSFTDVSEDLRACVVINKLTWTCRNRIHERACEAIF